MATRLAFAAVLHHMICAYVGPEYDFASDGDSRRCPKCAHSVSACDEACEIVGASARCTACHREMLVSPAPDTAASGVSRQD